MNHPPLFQEFCFHQKGLRHSIASGRKVDLYRDNCFTDRALLLPLQSTYGTACSFLYAYMSLNLHLS